VTRIRSAVILAAALTALAPLAARATTDARAGAPTGDARGLALLGRVHRAYAGVPGVVVSGRTGTLSFRFTLVLAAGTATAEEFDGHDTGGVTTLVARRPGPTYAREPGSSCWRPLSPSDPQAFENLGLPFPDQPAMAVHAPKKTARGWDLTAVADGTPATLAIDGATLQVRSITIAPRPGLRISERVAALASAPRVTTPSPRC
jgi:hypothetical protein